MVCWVSLCVDVERKRDIDKAIYVDGGDSLFEGEINATGGFATDTGVGWSGTYTVTEGVVTVRNGIIIDVDWD